MRSNLAVVCVAYVPEWEPLADALTRVMTSGVNEQQAKIEICQAIADKKIDIRVEIEKAAPDVGGKTLSGRNIDVPPRLHPDDFDWVQSRPLKPGETGPDSSNPSERYYSLWSWKPRSINFLEVRTSDVTAVLCTVTPQTKSLNLAPRAKISAAIKAVYDAADSAGEKPRTFAVHSPMSAFGQ
jgi:hypothetical protein